MSWKVAEVGNLNWSQNGLASHPRPHVLLTLKGILQKCLIHQILFYKPYKMINLSNYLLLVHSLSAIWASEHLIDLFRLHYRISTYNDSCDQTCKFLALSTIEQFTTKEPQCELSGQNIAWFSKLQSRDECYKFSPWFQIIIKTSLISQVDVPGYRAWEWDTCIGEVFDFKETFNINNTFKSKDWASDKCIWIEDFIFLDPYSPGIIFKNCIILFRHVLSILELACPKSS